MDDNQEFFGEAPPADQFDPSNFHEASFDSGQDAPSEAPSQEPEPQSNPALDHMRSQNYDVGQYESDEQLLNDIESGYQIAMKRQQEMEDLQRQLQAQQPQQAYEEEEYEDEEEYEGPPEIDESWMNLVEQDPATGRFVVKAEYIGSVDPSVAEKVNDYAQWRQTRSNALIDNPMQTLVDNGLEAYIQERIDNALNQNISNYDTKRQAEQWVASNSEVLYVTDPQTGQARVDPQTGHPLLTPIGQSLHDTHVALRNQGMYDPVQRHQVAMALIQPQIAQMQQAQQPVQDQPQAPQQQVPQMSQNEYHKQQYQQQPFSRPTNPGHMPNAKIQPQANGMGQNGLPEHQSLGSLATQLAVHKGFLQPNG